MKRNVTMHGQGWGGKLFVVLALMQFMSTNTWAQGKVIFKKDTKDADKWEIKAGETTVTPGQTIVPKDATVTLTYGGRLKVKDVTATLTEYDNEANINTASVTVPAGEHWLIKGSGTVTSNNITLGDGATVTLSGVNILVGSNDNNGKTFCILCEGSGTIILADGTQNSLETKDQKYAAIAAGPANTTLTIKGSGELDVKAMKYTAAIGGGDIYANDICGNIVIEGGIITAKGGQNAPAIGSDYVCHCGDITIKETVTCVTATGGTFALNCIGPGNLGSCGTVTIGGTKYWENNAYQNGGGTYLTQGPLIYLTAQNEVDLSKLNDDYKAKTGDVLKGELTGNYKITIAENAKVMLDGVVINGVNDASYPWAGLTCLGDAVIMLRDGSVNEVKGFCEDYPGIYVPGDKKFTSKNKTLTILGTGTLTATSNGYGAGIGGGYSAENRIADLSCGNIIIRGGVITATGGMFAAGIGGGCDSGCGNITISANELSVTATKGVNTLYSIGMGADTGTGSTCGKVIIGGTVFYDGSAYQNEGDTYLARSPLTCPAIAATVTTVPMATTGTIYAGSDTHLVTDGAADTAMMYAVTWSNTKPTTTDDFSETVPTAKSLTAGTYYVWYYAKGDANFSASAISDTGIKVTVTAAPE